MKRVVLVAVLVAVLAAACSSGSGKSTSTTATETSTSVVEVTTTIAAECVPWAEEMVAEFAEASGAVGIVAGISTAQCDQRVAVGFSDLEAEIPLDVGETFRIASISKTFTAVVAVRLAELGIWSLDDPVGDYVDGDFGEITIEQILSHTSGLTDVNYEGSLWDYLSDPAAVADRRAPVDSSLASPTRISPGSIQRYANVNYLIAGYAIEAASDASFQEVLQEHVTGVLELGSTGLETGETALPVHYERTPQATNPIPLSDLPTGLGSAAAWTAGGMVSSVEDLTVFAEGLFAGDVVSPQSVELMIDGFEGARSGYGLGVNVSSTDGTLVYGHNGRIIGFASAFRHTQEPGITVVVLTNDGASDVTILADNLLDRVLEDEVEG